MSSQTSAPLSEILRSKSSEVGVDDEPKKKSREDWRKAKELEEARKAGTAPAAVDEEGRDINPHIPQYISSAPWYFGSKGPTLKHQRPQPEKQREFSKLDEWYRRGVDNTKIITKFRKGACENCGAMTHKRKDCMERPRKIGAKFSGVKIGPDEFVQPDLALDFDGKRDRWAGYDPSQHKAIVEEYQKIEEAKRQLRAEKLNDADELEEEVDDEEDEDKYVDDFDMPGTKVDSKQRITVRNLRIREDTAKYLRNLDPNSAYYDPKTRSMRDNPDPSHDSNLEDADYAGENFVRFTGDTRSHAIAQKFAWEAYEKGVDVHLLAEPTKLEMLQKVYEKKKEEFKHDVQNSVIDKYGGEEHLEAPPKTLLLAQTEHYVEYSRYGKVIKGEEKPVIRSKYEEDVYPNNHTSVFGSFWKNGAWGYKCCFSFIKNSYCTGESGRSAVADAPAPEAIPEPVPVPLPPKEKSEESASSSSEEEGEKKKEDEEARKRRKKKMKKKKLYKEAKKLLKQEKKMKKKQEDDTYESRLKAALAKEDEEKEKAERLLSMDERKRPYNSMFDVQKPTDEEIDAYLMKRRREEDPMLQFM